MVKNRRGHQPTRKSNKKLVVTVGAFLVAVWLASRVDEWKGATGHG